MRSITFAAVSTLIFVAGCAGIAADQVMVHRTGPNELLKLRSGPGLDFGVIMGLPDGTVLNRRDCVTEIGQLWCRVSLADAPEVQGYVSADYISVI